MEVRMLFTTGNLITLGIVLVVLVIYRQLDRDNRSLEKVKKYAERLKDELSAYVDKRAEDLQRYGIELDVQQKAAKVALEKVQAVQEALSQRAEAIGGIEKRLGEYDTALSRLMEMTKRVDENLSRLHEEAEFTDQVAAKLDAAEKTMAGIERDLPALRASFAKDSAAALESFKGEMLADVGRRLGEVGALLEKAKAEANGTIRRAEEGRQELEREYAKAFEKARVEASKLEDVAFDKLREGTEAKAARLKDLMEEKFAQLGALAKEKATETQGMVKAIKAEWKAEADEASTSMAKSLDEAEARVKAQADSVSKAEASIAEAAAKMQAERDAIEARLAAEGAALASKAFDEFGHRLAEYQSEVEARFERLDAAGAELGQLDQALRATMDQTARRVENDFAAFGQALEDRRERFEEGFNAEAGKLRGNMKSLEDELDALKARAYDNVSEKLKVFEDEFFADLKTRSEEIEARLAAWRSDLDKTLSELSAASTAERVAAEKGFAEEHRARIAELQARSQDQLDKLRERIEALQDGIRAQSGMADEALAALKESVLKDAADARGTAQAYVEGEISRFSLESSGRLKNAERELGASLDALSASVAEEEERIRATREAVAQATTGFNDRFAEAVAEAEGRLRAELDKFSASSLALIDKAKTDYEDQSASFVQASQAERDRLAKELASLEDRTAELRTDLSGRISQALEGFSRGYESLLADLEKRRREAQAEGDTRLREYRDAVQDLALKLESSRAQAIAKAETEAARLSGVLAEIDKEQKAFVAQTKIFERTDELKDALAAGIESMKSDLARLDGRRAEIAEIENQLGKVKRLEDEVNQKVTRFLAEKRRIDSLEEDFSRLASVSQGVDKRLEEVTGQADALTQAQADIRKVLDLSKEADAAYERLEKKTGVIDATAEAVDKNFQQIQAVEKAVATLGGELRKLPERVTELKKSVDQLAAGQDKTEAAVRKLAELDADIADAEKRIAEVQKAREWVARAETRLEEIDRKAEEQLKLLSTLLKEEGGSGRASRERGAPTASVQETVRKLARQGWSVDEIARAVKVSRGEVELILELGGNS
jgi:chromosome segregation ATPase